MKAKEILISDPNSGNNLYFGTEESEWMYLRDWQGKVDFCLEELANIPQVRYLINALRVSEFGSTCDALSQDTGEWHCPYCYNSESKGHDDECDVMLALAPFKKSTGDKQCTK